MHCEYFQYLFSWLIMRDTIVCRFFGRIYFRCMMFHCALSYIHFLSLRFHYCIAELGSNGACWTLFSWRTVAIYCWFYRGVLLSYFTYVWLLEFWVAICLGNRVLRACLFSSRLFALCTFYCMWGRSIGRFRYCHISLWCYDVLLLGGCLWYYLWRISRPRTKQTST